MRSGETAAAPGRRPDHRSTAAPPGAPRKAETSALGGRGEPPALPCLSSNNCTETRSNRLSTTVRKSATALAFNVKSLADRYGLDMLGFLTLTFADHVTDAGEAQRRLHSLRTHVLAERYRAFIVVMERQKSGRIHFHLLVVLGEAIRPGCDFAAFKRRDYRSAPAALRSEWAFWRRTAKRYGFGRTELLPVCSSAEAMGRYVGKYLGKHMDSRRDDDKGVRLVRYSRDARRHSTRFSWATAGAAMWRRKVGLFVDMVGELNGDPRRSFAMLRDHLGPRWGYNWREFILGLPDPETGECDAG